MKKKQIGFVIIGIICILLVVWLAVSMLCKGSDIWKITLKDWVSLVATIVLGVFVAYILNVRNTQKWQFINAYVHTIDVLENRLDQYKDAIQKNYLTKDLRPIVLSFNKNIANAIELLAKYSNKMNVSDEISFIREHFASCKTTTADFTDALKEERNRIKATNEIDLILGKLNEMRLKQFEFE